MKHFLRLFVLLALFVSCSSKESTPSEQEDQSLLTLSVDSLVFSSVESSASFTVESDCNWSVKIIGTASEWISVNTTSGAGNGEITVSVSRNLTIERRVGTIYVAVINGKACKLTVYQDGGSGNSPITSNYPMDAVILFYNNFSAQGIFSESRALKYMITNDATNPKWLFDGYILSASNTAGGKSFMVADDASDLAVKSDWASLVNHHCRKVIPVLDKATVTAAEKTGVYAHKTKIIFTIPYPSYMQSVGWGELNGKSLDFTKNEDRIAACKWFIDQAVEQYRNGSFENIELVGFYWYLESLGISPKEHVTTEMLKEISDYIHSYGCQFYWIPYYDIEKYSDSRLPQWKNYGFDYTYLQPNYYFRNVSEDRMYDAVTKAHASNCFLEMEFDWNAISAYGRPNRASYLEKAKYYITEFDKYKVWETDPLTYYEYHAFEQIWSSSEPGDRTLYEMLSTRIAARQQKFYNIQYPTE